MKTEAKVVILQVGQLIISCCWTLLSKLLLWAMQEVIFFRSTAKICPVMRFSWTSQGLKFKFFISFQEGYQVSELGIPFWSCYPIFEYQSQLAVSKTIMQYCNIAYDNILDILIFSLSSITISKAFQHIFWGILALCIQGFFLLRCDSCIKKYFVKLATQICWLCFFFQ